MRSLQWNGSGCLRVCSGESELNPVSVDCMGVFFCTPHNVSHRSYLNNKFLYSVKYHITAMRRGSFVREADCVNLEN